MKNKNPKFSIREQRGVTLLLTVFILSGISLISLAVGFFALQEIRSSRAVILSEPAIGAAETGGEQGIWVLKRQLGSIPNCPDDPSDPEVQSTALSSNSRVVVCKSFGSTRVNLSAGVPASFYLYDPNDMNGNLCMNAIYTPGQYAGCAGNQIYTSVSIIHKSGTSNVQVSVQDLEGRTFAGSSITVAPGGSGSVAIPDPIPSSVDERLKVTLSSSTATVVEFNALPLGLPDYPTVNSSGCASRTTISNCTGSEEIFRRKINVTVPQ
jgi:hypothetical protein